MIFAEMLAFIKYKCLLFLVSRLCRSWKSNLLQINTLCIIVSKTFLTLILRVLLHKGLLFWLMNYAAKSKKTFSVWYQVYIYIYIRYSSYIKYIIYILHLFIYITLNFIEFPFSDHNPILIYYVYTDVLYHHLSVLVLVLVLTSVRHGNFSKKMS
jgi:hypothetical protein